MKAVRWPAPELAPYDCSVGCWRWIKYLKPTSIPNWSALTVGEMNTLLLGRVEVCTVFYQKAGRVQIGDVHASRWNYTLDACRCLWSDESKPGTQQNVMSTFGPIHLSSLHADVLRRSLAGLFGCSALVKRTSHSGTERID